MKRKHLGIFLSFCVIFSIVFTSFMMVKDSGGHITNGKIYPTLYIEIHKIQKLDDIEGPGEDGADWYYKIQVISGQEIINVTHYCKGDEDNPLINITHNFTVKTELVQIRIKLIEKDFWTGDDLADISGYPGGGLDNNIGDFRGAIYTAFYDLKNDSLWGDPTETLGGWVYTSGEFPSDNSTATDENDAAIQFKIWDNYNPPHANAGPDKTVNVNEIVNFDGSGSTASSGSSLVEYKWDFNNDGVFDATGKITSHTYTHVGTYTVKLEVTDSLGEKDDDSCTITVVSPPPEAKFTYSPKSPFTSTTIQFTDISSGYGKIISWHWNFGDGSTSSEQNPNHRYSDDGTYKVTLTVTDEYGKTDSTYKYITVKNVAPRADFVFSPSNPSILDNVHFSDASTDSDGYIASWHWDFGDGYTSNLKNPTHKYSQKKTYKVILTVTDDDGAKSNITKQITVINLHPIANFTWKPLHPKEKESIIFNFTGFDKDGYIVNWTWDFGDGKYAYVKNPTHKYSKDGKYEITLTVTDNDGGVSSYKQEISIGKRLPGFEIIAFIAAILLIVSIKRRK